MIKEAYCSFEVSKLLKEKGFDEVSYTFYDCNHKIFYREDGIPSWNSCRDDYAAPTHQMAMAWLREVYNIDIIIFHEKLPNDCYWVRVERNLFTEIQQKPKYKSYEEAVEAALKYILENLI